MKRRLLQGSMIPIALAAVVLLAGCMSAFPTATEPAPTTADEVPRITVEELKSRLDAGKKVVVVDTRSRQSYDNRHIAGAVSIPGSELAERYAELPRAVQIVLY
ncbi:MAG TPA: rhodanese-like domain-containing protein [Anaerolineae bacterium]|nr:rhodanese-like domain-containing protein [Anaerolineae bacterium]